MTARTLILSVLIWSLVGCDKAPVTRDPALPDNVTEDKPIILREGQAVILIPEQNRALMIAAAVTDGKLAVSEIDPYGRDFGVTWTDQERWQTTTSISGNDERTMIIDRDGDGLPDLKFVVSDGRTTRYELIAPAWKEIAPAEKKSSEQILPPDGP